MLKSYRELDVWQEAWALVEAIYALSTRFPSEERFGLSSQIRRSSVSIPSNIAEGHARPTTRDYLRFIGISLGSLAEMETQLLLAQRLGYIDHATLDATLQASERVGRMLRGLSKSLNAKASFSQSPVPSP
jgi:four helix bundle protein